MKRLVLALAIAVAIGGVGLLLSREVLHLGEEPGPKLRRECASLVDTVLQEDRTAPGSDIVKELARRGITAPTYPDLKSYWDRGTAGLQEHEAAQKAYEAKWEELRGHPLYQAAWEAAFAKKREDAVKDCIVNRAKREGVVIR